MKQTNMSIHHTQIVLDPKYVQQEKFGCSFLMKRNTFVLCLDSHQNVVFDELRDALAIPKVGSKMGSDKACDS